MVMHVLLILAIARRDALILLFLIISVMIPVLVRLNIAIKKRVAFILLLTVKITAFVR
jgi:hypothetical protein